ncbi:T-complex protein 1 subunit eta [Aduncisulcus paluster]|uniref:T-complex protein 1 subunit eta n=1 Tax=Aduncisulcus paluster TaxID=2918883 RepID=A0ABQ5KR71_9EUKA|nr:T-complex protein 1 subunit eta [Aduncisulcus paluster]|eukprot:gnl/Carplike_NY0171/1961_a2651_992.p1 GENE.gnl/Carplike_NY0171/1961_a2651_992~~gnl/Carplike_NY0171/1961_a2651_992.p1  ORF type:complete len:584 (+),score=211.37 gnl/Carplike_NY0171/1961_a2651_992:2-1753(+)
MRVVLLKGKQETSVVQNINACYSISSLLATTLGPRGCDKLITELNGHTTSSNDGATIIKLLDVVHPAARLLLDISTSQDVEIGDGTTTVVLIAGELLSAAKPFIHDGVHPRPLIEAFRKSCALCVDHLKKVAIKPEGARGTPEFRDRLKKLASTAMNSKLISAHKGLFSEIVVSAIEGLDEDLDLDMIGIKEVLGGSLSDSVLIDGIAFEKSFSYAGFEQLPKIFKDPIISCVHIELEKKAERDNAQVKLDDPEKYREIIEAEFKRLYTQLDDIISCGANVILSDLPVGDLATQYCAKYGVFVAGRIDSTDLKRVADATHSKIISSTSGLKAYKKKFEELKKADPDTKHAIFGTCKKFEETQVGKKRYSNFTGCPSHTARTIILRGGAEQFIKETERSLHDALEVVRRAIKAPDMVAGGGAIDMQLSCMLRKHAKTIPGKEQVFMKAFADALEIIPRQLSSNAGFDITKVMNKLRAAHTVAQSAPGKEPCWLGVDIESDSDVCDTMKSHVWEPVLIKLNAIKSATEAACMILCVDETISAPQDDAQQLREGRERQAMIKRRLDAAGMQGHVGGMQAFQGRGGK